MQVERRSVTKAKEEGEKQTCWLGDRMLISGLGEELCGVDV